MGARKVPTFKAWAEKDGPFCGQTKLAINQKTNEGEDTWSMIPDLDLSVLSPGHRFIS